jgi:hypothetical protein
MPLFPPQNLFILWATLAERKKQWQPRPRQSGSSAQSRCSLKPLWRERKSAKKRSAWLKKRVLSTKSVASWRCWHASLRDSAALRLTHCRRPQLQTLPTNLQRLSASATLPGTGEGPARFMFCIHIHYAQRCCSFSISRLARQGNRRCVLQAPSRLNFRTRFPTVLLMCSPLQR